MREGAAQKPQPWQSFWRTQRMPLSKTLFMVMSFHFMAAGRR